MHSSVKLLLQTDNSMTGRAYIGEVLMRIWLKSMSELLDKQVNAQKEGLKNFQGSRKLLQAHKKACNDNERKKKRLPCKKFCGDRKAFIRLY